MTGQSTDPGEEFVFVQYKGHTLQGSYDGGFVYARKPFLPKSALAKVARVAKVTQRFFVELVFMGLIRRSGYVLNQLSRLSSLSCG